MNKAPAFQFYAADFLVDTAEMTSQEVGVYIRLLSHQWVNGSLNGDPNRLANGVAMDVLEVWNEIKHKFDMGADGRLRNPKLEKVRQIQEDYRNKQSEAGKRGAEKRWDSNHNGKSMATPLPKHGDPNGDHNGENIALQSSSSSSSSSLTSSLKNNMPDKSDIPPDQKIKRNQQFKKPEISEIEEYCRERKNSVSPEGFFDHYEANGWVRGKTKIKDWKACVRTWEKNSTGSQPAKTNNHTGFENKDYQSGATDPETLEWLK